MVACVVVEYIVHEIINSVHHRLIVNSIMQYVNMNSRV